MSAALAGSIAAFRTLPVRPSRGGIVGGASIHPWPPSRSGVLRGLRRARVPGQTGAMGRIVDLFADVAASSEDGPEGLVLPAEDWERLRAEWRDEDLEDILALVRDSVYQTELVDAADSL